MKNTLALFDTPEDAAKLFRKKDVEGHNIINNILLNGHLDMLQYVFEKWLDAHKGLTLTLDGNITLLHQAFCQATFSSTKIEENEQEEIYEFT